MSVEKFSIILSRQMEATGYIYTETANKCSNNNKHQQKRLFHSRSINNLSHYYKLKARMKGCLLRAPEQITIAN